MSAKKYSTVVSTVFDKFIGELRDRGLIDSTVLSRIEAALAQGDSSVDKLRKALFSEDPLQ